MRKGRIFISYRRDDAAGYARSIYDRLDARFPKSIFMDASRIEPGADFVKAIEEAVGACDTLIVLMGKHWRGGRAPSEGRLDDPNDFVRLEIATALKRNIQVIPVLLREAKPPGAQDLPDDIAQLARIHALEITDEDFDHDIQRLASHIKLSSDGGRRWRKVILTIGGAALLLIAVVVFGFFNRERANPRPRLATAGPETTPTLPSPTAKSPEMGDIFKQVAAPLVPLGPRPAASEKISGQPASAEVRAAIRKNYDRLSEAYAKRDLQAFKAVYAPDFVARDGQMVIDAETAFSNKQALFAMGMSPTVTHDIGDVIMTGPDTAVVTVKSEVDFGVMRAIETDRDTWKHIGDEWLVSESIVLEMH
jgi:ketosteroid isomerase-like protein